MTKTLVIALIVAITLAAWPLAGQAQAELAVISSSHENRLPDEVIFRLEAEGPATIDKVTLFYQIQGVPSRAYAYPRFTPGQRISAEVALKNNTQKTYIPPGTEITYFWQIEDVARHSLKSQPTTFAGDDSRFQWRSISRGGISLYWYQGSESWADDLINQALAGLERLSSEAGIRYEQPMKVFVYSSKLDMDPALPKRSQVYTRYTVTLGVMLSADVMLLLGSHPEVRETLPHELCHMVIHQVTENPYTELPAWLDEGLAMNAEPGIAGRYQAALSEAARSGQLIPVRWMTGQSGDPAQVTLFYAESYSLVRFLIDTYGKDKMRQLLEVFKQGRRFDEVLTTVYSFDVEGLDAQWRASLGLEPRPTPAPQESDKTSRTSSALPFIIGALAIFVMLGAVALALITVMARRRL